MRLLTNRTTVTVGAVGLAAIFAGCGGGGGSSSLPNPTPIVAPTSGSQAPASAQYANVTFTILWPASTSASANRRRPDYISPSTQSIAISVNGGTRLVVVNPNVAGGTTATSAPSTSVIVPAPIGPDAFSIGDYDDTKAAGNLLAESTISYTVVAGAANVVPITLNGNLGKVVCSGGAPYTSPAGMIAAASPQAFTITGPAGQLSVVPEDADSNIIVAPGIVPSLSLTAATPSQATISATSTANTYTVNPAVVGTAVTLNVSGKTLAGSTIAGSCTVTRQLAVYITNHFNNQIGSAQYSTAAQNASVTIYPASATGAATPTATIQGSNTQLAAVQYIAVDPAGNIFVSNIGPAPGATFGPTSGFISIYSAGSNGNVAPVNTIANLQTPEGLAFDKNGTFYALSIDRIQEFPASADGVTAAGAAAPATPTTVITGTNTDLFSCYGLAVGPTLNIATACSNVANVFAAGATGNATPGIIELPVTGTGVGYQSDSWLGVSIDSSGNVELPGANNNQNNVNVYTAANLPASGAKYTTPGTTSALGVDFSQPFGIAVDSNAADANTTYYVVNYGNNTMSTFTSLTTLEAGVGTMNAFTGLNQPYGIAVR
jgi:hypothetical protein